MAFVKRRKRVRDTPGPGHLPPHYFETLARNPSNLPSQFFEDLVTEIQAQEGLKAPFLKSLYRLLHCLSMSTSTSSLVNYSNPKAVSDLSDIMFKLLFESFKPLFSSSQAPEQSGLLSDFWNTADELILLLRCCLVILTFLMIDQNLLEKYQVFFSIFSRLCSSDLNGGGERNAICRILEVYADELLMHRPLGEYFMLTDSFSSISEMLFNHPRYGHFASVLEAISAHFLLSFSDKQAYGDFLKRFWQCSYRVPELNQITALSLLTNPIMHSAPNVFQAHVISLVSETISIDMGSGDMGPDYIFIDCYLSAFETSVILYTRHISGLEMDGHPVAANSSVTKASIPGRSFESVILPLTRDKIDHLVAELESSWDTHKCNMSVSTEPDLVSASLEYMESIDNVLHESCKDILRCIILKVSGNHRDISFDKKADANPQDVCLLTSVLKLMSNSLLQVLRCVRHSEKFGPLKSLKDFSSCKEYNIIVGILGCFKQYDVCMPTQKILGDMMNGFSSDMPIHKESKLMLLHLSALLSFGFSSGLDFLVKGCMHTMMTLMNLFIFEEGNLDALRSLLTLGSESFSSGLFPDNVVEAPMNHDYSLIVASKFQKSRALCTSSKSVLSRCTKAQYEQSAILYIENGKESVVGTEEETCNGEAWLNCRLEEDGAKKPDDFNDLVDFIECKQGRDYDAWLKNREKCRFWRRKKLKSLMNQRKKNVVGYLKGKKLGYLKGKKLVAKALVR